MNYIDLFDQKIFRENSQGEVRNIDFGKPPIESTNYEFVRYGEPDGTISFKEVKEDRDRLIRAYNNSGWSNPPKCNNSEFQKHVSYFRTCLDFWEEFSRDRVFSKEEIYIRCLREGPSFAEYIKKCRATCLRVYSSETETDYDEEYFHESYSGYNSIIHERYLIHFKTPEEEVDDVKYSFIAVSEKDHDEEFAEMVDKLFTDFKISDCRFDEKIDMIESIKNSKMVNPINGKTSLIRDLWDEDIPIKSPYYAKRCVVNVEPGNIRDTGIGDPATLLKVKILNRLARVISERIPFCANTTAKEANSRLLRVLKRQMFLHLDFKKFGLTFPRRLMNILIKKIGQYSGIDTSDLIIDKFCIEIDKVTYATSRGTVLGWLDCINCLCVTAILYNLSTERELNFDFVTFNDDVEISFRVVRDPKNHAELLRAAVIAKLSYFDILISLDKTYASFASVFLERYAYFDDEYGLDMYKEQLTVKAYAQSCVTKFPWRAKMLFAAAEQWTKSKYATNRCIDTCPIEFRPEEQGTHLFCGGWYIRIQNGLDTCLNEDDLDVMMGVHLTRWKPPNYSPYPENNPGQDEMVEATNKKSYHAQSSEKGIDLFKMTDTLSDINREDGMLLGFSRVIAANYFGREIDFPSKALSVIEEINEGIDWGPTV